jgi:His/Glu/Gln/Arg/opine family amino acid ABC transporter permease subunit
MRLLDTEFMVHIIPALLAGVPVCLKIACVSMLLGSVIGLLTALCRIYKLPALHQAASLYISFVRGTPLMVQILITYYGIPTLFRYVNFRFGTQFDISGVPAIYFMYFCFSLCNGAYLSEMFRSAILSVDPGQMEASQSIGMTTRQGLMRIVIPQALTNAIPNMGNTFISLIKDTSLAFTASITEIMGQAKIVAGRTSKFFEAYIVAAIIYWLLCIVFEQILRKLERYSRQYERNGRKLRADGLRTKETAVSPEEA